MRTMKERAAGRQAVHDGSDEAGFDSDNIRWADIASQMSVGLRSASLGERCYS